MSKNLVVYFSATGVTAKLAQSLADVVKADLFEIKPQVPYTQADLDWNNKKSRSSIEMKDLSFRPPIAQKLSNIEDYDVIFLGFPIWWYIAPTIINTFLESHNLKGKKIIPFATSGGSSMGKTNEKLRSSCKGATLYEGKVLNGVQSKATLKAWVDSFIEISIGGTD